MKYKKNIFKTVYTCGMIIILVIYGFAITLFYWLLLLCMKIYELFQRE